jgi:hypothetical protein
LAAVGLLLVAMPLGYCHARTTQLNAAFNTVAIGDAEDDVVAKMGRPHRTIEGCGYYHGRPAAGCAQEFVYFPPWTIVDEAWSVSFNESKVVISTAHFVSP